MNHLILFGICLLSVEIIIKSNYFKLSSSLFELIQKAIYIISSKNITEYWKATILPKYSMMMMMLSLKMILIIFLIIFIFVIVNNFFSSFLALSLSWNGIVESIFFTFGYAYIRKIIFK